MRLRPCIVPVGNNDALRKSEPRRSAPSVDPSPPASVLMLAHPLPYAGNAWACPFHLAEPERMSVEMLMVIEVAALHGS